MLPNRLSTLANTCLGAYIGRTCKVWDVLTFGHPLGLAGDMRHKSDRRQHCLVDANPNLNAEREPEAKAGRDLRLFKAPVPAPNGQLARICA